MPEQTVGTEAMSDRARPRSMEGVRLVEEGREKSFAREWLDWLEDARRLLERAPRRAK